MTIATLQPSVRKMYGTLASGDSAARGETASQVVVSQFLTPVGPMLAGATKNGVCLLEFEDRPLLGTQLTRLGKRFGGTVIPGDNEHTARLRQELDDYFLGRLQRFTTPLVLTGTGFQVAAWKGLLEIPYGETISYQQQARSIGRPGAQRAIGRANGDNRMAIVIPCHRVVRQNGDLCGYGGGLWRKKFLIDLEHQHRGATRT